MISRFHFTYEICIYYLPIRFQNSNNVWKVNTKRGVIARVANGSITSFMPFVQASASAIAHSGPGNHLRYFLKRYKRVNFSQKSSSVVLIPEDCRNPSTMQTVSRKLFQKILVLLVHISIYVMKFSKYLE